MAAAGTIAQPASGNCPAKTHRWYRLGSADAAMSVSGEHRGRKFRSCASACTAARAVGAQATWRTWANAACVGCAGSLRRLQRVGGDAMALRQCRVAPAAVPVGLPDGVVASDGGKMHIDRRASHLSP